jgi:putative transposase
VFVLEYKVYPKQSQVDAINKAIRTTQFVRNKVLRFWMDNRGVGKTEMFRYNTRLRKEYSFVTELNSHACQTAVERTLRAITRFYDNCKNKVKGKKGYPKFKHNTRSVEYKVSGWRLEETKKHITFTDKKGIGMLKLVGSRDINFFQPEQIKRVRILKRADGFYVQFCIKLDPRDTINPIEPSGKAIGLDVGLKYFLADSQGNIEPNPRYYRKAEKRLNKLNRRKSKKFIKGKKQSNNYQKARQRYACANLKVSRKREEFVKSVALRLVKSNDLLFCEDLSVKNMVKNRRLSKSISDAGWFLFRRWLEYFADKYGKVAIAIPPHGTSQNCSNCGQKVEKTLSTRTHICPHCNYVEDRDVNAGKNILQKGLSRLGRSRTHAWGDLPSSLIGEILSGYGESLNQESSRL